MVAVAQNHVGKVALPPGIEMLLVVARLPLVERLVDDHKAEAVAHVEKFAGRLVMGTADGIAAVLLQYAETTQIGGIGHSSTQTACLAVQTESLELERLVVEQEAAIAVEGNGAHAERRGALVNGAPSGLDDGLKLVEIGGGHAVP